MRASPTLIELLDPRRLASQTDGASYARGRAYAEDGRVSGLQYVDNRLTANVIGTRGYRVELAAAKNGHVIGTCNCPMGDQGLFCKHCVAVAFAAAELLGTPSKPESSKEPRFAGDADLEAYLSEHGLEHVRHVGAEALLPFVPEPDRASLRYVLSRQRLVEFATDEAVNRRGHPLGYSARLRQALPGIALRFLENEIDRLKRAREELRGLLSLPADPEAHAAVHALLNLRSTHPASIPPGPGDNFPQEQLRFSDALPGFMWVDQVPWVPPDRQVPTVTAVELKITADSASARCASCGDTCIHTLGAIDATLRLLHEPLTPQRRAWFEDLRRPAWERALRAIDKAIEESGQPSNDTFVCWRLSIVEGEGVDVQPWLHRLTKKGVPNAGTRISPSRLLDEHRDSLSPEDRHIAMLAADTLGYAEEPLLKALVGHPRLFLLHNPNAAVTVESARVGLLADHRGESVVLMPALDGAPLPEPLARKLTKQMFFFEESSRRLTLLEVPPEVLRTLDALSRFGNDFPQESHAALVEKLSSLSARIPVAMPRTVMGEEVPPERHPVLRIQAQPTGSVRLEIRIRPLPESAAFVPGEGSRDVHVRRDGKPLHAKRDFVAEVAVADTIVERLRISDAAEEQAFSFLIQDPQRALAMLNDLESWDEPRPTLEWVGEPMRIVGHAAPASLRVVLEKKRDWFGVTGGLSVAGERIALAVALDAARRQERFVQVQERTWVEISEALRLHLQKLSDHTWRSSHGLEVGPSAAEALSAIEDSGSTVDADKTWKALAERIFASKQLEPKVPASLKATLRDYQVEGVQWMLRLASWGAGAVLADDMGLGKTVQALAVLQDRAKLGPALVVAPTSVGFNWVDETKRFTPRLRIHVFAESPDRGATLEALRARDVLVVSYGLLLRDAERLSKVRFSTIVFDEAQALKNASTARARAARQLQGEFKIALTGTPLENHLGELWSLFRTVFPGLFGSWEAFRDRFATPIEKKYDPTAAPALSRVLQPFLLRRTKQQVARELPPRTDQRVPVVLSTEEWQLYEDARLAAISDLETPKREMREQQRRVQVLAALTRLRLLASHPKLYDARSSVSSSKLRRLMELLDELRSEGHRTLVFSQFTKHLALVREALDARGIRYLSLEGRTRRSEREQLVRQFQDGETDVFLISLKAGGFGLNLTGADNVIHLDPWWNPAVEDQASDRAHRIGQDKPVTVYRLVSKGTIEEQILALHEDKRQLVTGVLDGKDQAARLSTHELLTMLSQPAAALADLESPSNEKH